MEKVYRPKGTKLPNVKIFLLPSIMKIGKKNKKKLKFRNQIVDFRPLNGNNELEARVWTIIIKFGRKINSFMKF